MTDFNLEKEDYHQYSELLCEDCKWAGTQAQIDNNDGFCPECGSDHFFILKPNYQDNKNL